MDVSDRTEPQPDFIAHLAERFGVTRERALGVLGAWLVHYEPLKRTS